METWTSANLFAGIDGFGMGLTRAGIRTVAAVEIEDKARGVLKHRFPDVTLFNDVCEVGADDILAAGFVPERGVLTAGFPCQDVSIAGKRAGLAGARTGLFSEVIRILEGLQPRWFLLENVPGLLTSNRGRDMGTVVGALAELGYGVGWRVLDAQYFGVPQRRRRVFIAGCLGDIARAGEVLLEPEGSPGDLAAGGAPREKTSRAAEDGAVRRGGAGLLADRGLVQAITSSLATGGPDAQHAQAGWLIPEKVSVPEIAGTLTSRYQKGVNTTADDGALVVTCDEAAATLTAGSSSPKVSAPGRRQEDDINLVTYRKSKRARAKDDDETWLEAERTNTLNCFDTGDTRATDLVTFAFQPTTGGPGDNLKAVPTDVAPSLTSTDLAKVTDRGLRVVSPTDAVAFALRGRDGGINPEITGDGQTTGTLRAASGGSSKDYLAGEWGVRRLTPMECERLQGFPDNHTAERVELNPKSKKYGQVVVQSDSARGHQLGNAVAVPVIEWIGRRILESEQ